MSEQIVQWKHGTSLTTLRDHFAGMAMQPMLCDRDRNKGVHEVTFEWDMDIAKRAYRMADAMMHAREIKD